MTKPDFVNFRARLAKCARCGANFPQLTPKCLACDMCSIAYTADRKKVNQVKRRATLRARAERKRRREA